MSVGEVNYFGGGAYRWRIDSYEFSMINLSHGRRIIVSPDFHFRNYPYYFQVICSEELLEITLQSRYLVFKPFRLGVSIEMRTADYKYLYFIREDIDFCGYWSRLFSTDTSGRPGCYPLRHNMEVLFELRMLDTENNASNRDGSRLSDEEENEAEQTDSGEGTSIRDLLRQLGFGKQDKAVQTEEEFRKEDKAAQTEEEFRKEDKAAQTEEEVRKKNKAAQTEEEVRKENKAAQTEEEVQNENKAAETKEEVRKENKAAQTEEEVRKENKAAQSNPNAGTAIPDSPSVKKLQNSLKRGEGCDATIKVQGKEFPVHRVIFQGSSPLLSSKVSDEKEEKPNGDVVIDGCDPEAFGDYWKYLHTRSTTHIENKNVCHLYTISVKFRDKMLKDACVSLMKRNLSICTFCDVLTLARQHSEKELADLLTQFFCANAEEIINTVQWKTFLQRNATMGNELFIKYVSMGKHP